MEIRRFILIVACFALGATTVQAQSSTASDQSPKPTSTASISLPDTSTGTNGVSPSQSSAFSVALQSYLTSLEQSPQVSHIGVDIYLQDSDAARALQSNPAQLLPIDVTATTIDLRSLATAPPLTFSSLSIYSNLDPWLVSSIQSMQTSAALDIARIDQRVLGISASLPDPTSSASTGAAVQLAAARPTGLAAVGAAVGVLGAAAAMI